MNAGSGGLAACSTRGARTARAVVQRRADKDTAGGAGIFDDKAGADEAGDDHVGDSHADDDHAGGDAGANDLRP
ncbi:MAG TPA: hypothetical protein VGN31_17715 [Paraburkholderia sp.]